MKILIIGPFPLPTTGVSLANQVVFQELKKSSNYKVSSINTSYHSFDEKLGILSFKKLWFYIKLQVYFFKIFNNDIIYITPGQTFYGVIKYALFIIASSLSRKTIVQHIHGNFLGKQYQLLRGVKKKIFHYLMSQTDKGIVLSESLKPNFQPFIKSEKIHAVKNFVIDELLFENQVVEKKNYSDLRIVYLSNLMPEKGIFQLLEALLLLEKKGVVFNAKIAGNLTLENQDRINNYFFQLKNVEYIGVVDKKQKIELFKWSNIFVLPTYYVMEGQPIAILEAMASGNVIVTTSHAGIPDIFEDKINGYYVNSKDTLSIVTKLEYISNYKEQLKIISFNNAKIAKQEYRVHTFISNLKTVFNSN